MTQPDSNEVVGSGTSDLVMTQVVGHSGLNDAACRGNDRDVVVSLLAEAAFDYRFVEGSEGIKDSLERPGGDRGGIITNRCTAFSLQLQFLGQIERHQHRKLLGARAWCCPTKLVEKPVHLPRQPMNPGIVSLRANREGQFHDLDVDPPLYRRHRTPPLAVGRVDQRRHWLQAKERCVMMKVL